MPNGDDYDEDAARRSKEAADRAWEQAQKEKAEQQAAAERNEN